MGFVYCIIGADVVSVNGGYVQRFFRLLRVVCCAQAGRDFSVDGDEFVSGGVYSLYLSALRGPLSETLARIIKVKLRNGTMRAGCQEIVLYLTVHVVFLVAMMSDCAGRAIYGGIFSHFITLRSD